MENEELRVENSIAEEASGPAVLPEPEAPEAAAEEKIEPVEEAAKRVPNHGPLQGLEADGELNAPETRMTPEYLRFLEEKERQYAEEAALEASSRTIPVPESDDEKKKRTLALQMDHQKQIIEQNRRAWFGRKRRIRKEAEARLAELEREYAELP